MKSRKQGGFGSIEFILLLVVIGLIVGVALNVMQQTKTVNNAATTTENTDTQSSTKPDDDGWTQKDAGSRIFSPNKAFSIEVPGGWEFVVYEGKDAVSSSGSCIDNSCVGGFMDAPDKPISFNTFRNRDIDFYAVRFALFTEDSFVQKFTNEKAEKSDFGPVDGVIGTRYHQKLAKTVEYQKEKEGHEIYEYAFAKNDKFYHVYYDIYGEEANKIDTVETAIRTLTFDK